MKLIDLTEAGRVFRVGVSKGKRGAPEEPARAFDEPGRDRWVLPQKRPLEFHVVEVAHERDYFACGVYSNRVEAMTSHQYYGVNVVFFRDKDVELQWDDPIAGHEARKYRNLIIAACFDNKQRAKEIRDFVVSEPDLGDD